MLRQILWAGLLAGLTSISPAHGAAASSVETRLAQQNALFDEQYESDLKARPELATAYGDYRYNDQLNDYSIAAAEQQHQRDLSFLKRLESIAVAGFPEQDALSHQVMQRLLEQRLANYDFKEYEMPVNQMDGPQVHLADLPLAVPLFTVKQYDDYIAR
ncbi:MAG TPA: DUF885 family protein, partial [Steroidobacteraceae bacterium]